MRFLTAARNVVAETIAGVKTFTSAIVASAGVQLSALWNTNGSLSTDVCVRSGTSLVSGSLHASSKLHQWGPGVGATFVEKAAVYGDGSFLTYRGCGIWLDGDKTGGQLYSNTGGLNFDYGNVREFNVRELGYTYSLKPFGHGTIGDDSGTPGAASRNAPKGRAAVASGASSVVITNTFVTTDCYIGIEWEDLPGLFHKVVPAAGSFTLTLSGNAGANLKFRWFVIR